MRMMGCRRVVLLGIGVFFLMGVSGLAFAESEMAEGIHTTDYRKGEYSVYLPVGYDPSIRRPAVFVVNLYSGLATDGESLDMMMNSWIEKANEAGFVAVIPSAGSVSRLREEWFVEVAQRVKKQYNTDPRRTFIVGFAEGGDSALLMACHNPGLFKGVAAVASDFRYHKKEVHYKSGDRARIYLLTGEKDDQVPPKNMKALADELEKNKYEVRVDVLPGVAHSWSEDATDKIWLWFQNLI